MNRVYPKFTTVFLLGFVTALLAWNAPLRGADTLNWQQKKNSVDADITSWSVVRTLETIARASGWQVYLEPGAKGTVSTKFQNRSRDSALDLLLGDLGRVLLPGTNGGPRRLLVFHTAQRNATRRIQPPHESTAKPIPNELIVTLKPGVDADELAKKLGAKITGRIDDPKMVRLEFEDETAADLARELLLNDDTVEAVDYNYPIAGPPSPKNSATPGFANLKLAPVKPGEAVIVALLDTAIQPQGTSFDELFLDSISVAGASNPPEDHPSHGTAMAGALANGLMRFAADGEGTRVRILPIDVYGPSKTTSTFQLAEGIYVAMKNGASVINISSGSDAESPYLQSMTRQSVEAGAVVIASAGNTPVTTPTYPAADPWVIAVTAGDRNGQLAPYANRGAFVDVMAPGTATILFNGDNWVVTGTSPAAASFSGAVAGKADTGQMAPGQAAASFMQQPSAR